MSRSFVRDLHGPFDARTFASLPYEARVQWRDSLAVSDLGRVADWLRSRPSARLRLYGNACRQIGELAPFLPARLELDAPRLPDRLPPLPGVRDLTLEGAPPDLTSLLVAVPALETLQGDFRGADFDLAALSKVRNLQRLSLAKARLCGVPPTQSLSRLHALELRDVGTECVSEMLRMPGIRALRLCRVAGLRSIDALTGHPHLRVLALESLTHLESLHVLATLPNLESLDIAGLWQFSLAEAGFISTLSGLRRLAIDIGGRRKNVEISKRLARAKPAPFDIRDAVYDLITS